MLANIRDRRVWRQIINKLRTLAQDPESAGKPLVGDCYSIRAAAGRYRVIYRIVDDRLIVLVWPWGFAGRVIGGTSTRWRGG